MVVGGLFNGWLLVERGWIVWGVVVGGLFSGWLLVGKKGVDC